MKKICYGLLVVCIVLQLAACASPLQATSGMLSSPLAPTEASTATAAHRKKIALVMKTLTNPFFIEMEKGARDAERALGVDLVVRTATQETSIEQQIDIVEDLIRTGVDAIVLAPADSIRLIPVVLKASGAGIVVINIDNQLDPAILAQQGLKDLPFIGPDNEAGAYLAAKELVRWITQPTRVAILEGIREANNAEARKEGALRAFQENPYVQVTAMETANWKIDEAYQVTKELMTGDATIGAIFCANDMMALGAVEYLNETGRKDVRVVGFDNLAEARQAIEEGKLAATVDQQAARQGFLGVEYAVKSLNGEKIPALTKIDTILVTAVELKK